MASNSHAVIRPHFRLICTPAQQTQGEWLASLVETVQPNAGATVRVGWSVLRLQSFDGKLVLCEPDFDGNPFTDFRPSVSTTLEVLAAEKSLLDRAGCAPVNAQAGGAGGFVGVSAASGAPRAPCRLCIACRVDSGLGWPYARSSDGRE